MIWVCLKAGGIPPIYGQFDRENESVGIGDVLRASPGKTWTYQLPCQTSAGVAAPWAPWASHRFFDLAAALANIQMPEDLKPQKPPGRPRARRPTAPAQVTWLQRSGGFSWFVRAFSVWNSHLVWGFNMFHPFSSIFHPFSVFHPCGFDNPRLVASGRRVPPEISRPERRRASPRARNGVARPDVPWCATLPHMDGIGMNGKYTHDQDIPR